MKKLISIVLVICMMFSLSSVALATDAAPIAAADGELDVSKLADVELTPLPVRETGATTYGLTKAAAATYEYFSVQDYITTDGEIAAYGVFPLYANEILQVGLQPPAIASIDYDLYIAGADADGNLTEILATSTYSTYVGNEMSNTVDEGIEYINTGTDTENVAVLVVSNYGFNNTYPYTLYMAFDSMDNCSVNESDQNAAFASVTLNVGSSLTGYKLNSPADMDWYYLDVAVDPENASEDISLALTDPATGAAITTDSVQVYAHIGNNQLDLISPTNGVYRFTPDTDGTFYLRVTPGNRDSFTPHAYTLTAALEEESPITPEPEPDPDPTPGLPADAYTTITKYSTSTDPNGTRYVLWPQFPVAGYIVDVSSSGWFQVDGELRDGSGNLLTNQNVYVKVAFQNRYWQSVGSDMGNVVMSAPINPDGTFSVRITNMPPAAGMMHMYYNSASNLEHYYDLADVVVTVCDENNNDYDSVSVNRGVVYHRSYYKQP